jgi:hypothetical protein
MQSSSRLMVSIFIYSQNYFRYLFVYVTSIEV